MSDKRSNLVNVGRLNAAHGVNGWIKLRSFTEPKENILQYKPWWLKTKHGVKQVEVLDSRPHTDGFVVQLKGIDDRDSASALALVDVAVEYSQMPNLDDGDFYWHQLIGLKVVSEFGDAETLLGEVKQIIETGANDVLVVKPNSDSIERNGIEQKEHLVPYVLDQYIKKIDLEAGEIRVDWDPEF